MNASSRVELRVVPGAVRTAVVGRHGGAWKLSVTAPAESGRANAAVEALLADILDLPRRSVSIVQGRSARTKVAELDGVTAEAVAARLESAAVKRGRS